MLIITIIKHGTIMLWNADIQLDHNYYIASESYDYRFSFDPFFFLEEMPNPLVLCGSAKLTEEYLSYLPYARNVQTRQFKNCNLLTNKALELIPNSVTCLELINCRGFTDEGIKNLSFLPKLKRLKISQCQNIQGKTFTSLPFGLKYLEVNACENFLDEGVSALNFHSKLKEVSFINCMQLTGATLDQLPRRIKTLTIKQCPWITDLSVRNLFYLSKLTSLNLSFCPRIIGGTLGYLPKSLEKLDLKGCSYLICIETLSPLTQLNFLDVSLTPITDLYLPFLQKLQIDEIIIGPCEELIEPNAISYYSES